VIRGVVAEIGEQIGLDGRRYPAVVVAVDIATCRAAAVLMNQPVEIASVIEHRSSAPTPDEAFAGALDSDARAEQDTHYAR
jgi:hypothetical protein